MQLKEELKEIEDREAEGYLILKEGLRSIERCSIQEILYHFKKKEELQRKINDIEKRSLNKGNEFKHFDNK